MSGNRVTFTLSPKSPYVDCSWMDGPQVGRKTIEFSAFVKAIQESAPGADSMLRSAAAGDAQLFRKLKSPNHDDRGILR